MVVVAAPARWSRRPLVVGALIRIDRDQTGGARERERQRFAAHLHDSVLQTLALVQRQATTRPPSCGWPGARSTRCGRGWRVRRSSVAETLGSALREVVAGVEDEHGITIELTAIGDRPLDERGEALVAAAREALRNAARHAGGAPVYVFAEIIGPRRRGVHPRRGAGLRARTVAAGAARDP